jgi:FkbM family methyltransferase
VATLAHNFSRLMPAPLVRGLRPRWHRWRDTALFVTTKGGRLTHDRALDCRIAARRFDGRWLEVAVRSYRELRRYLQFGGDAGDVVHRWMHEITDAEVVYDVGSANGLEGFLMHHLHGAKIVFIEPYTPSIETLLKTIARQVRQSGVTASDFEVVHAGCDSAPGYRRYLYHGLPVPGETGNTFADPDAYCRGGRAHMPVTMSQWTASVSLDSLHHEYGLPLATHVKMDVDGFENRAMEGAKRLLAGGTVKSWAIEINGNENLVAIRKLMADHGYVEVASWEHYPGYEHYTGDHIFVRASDEVRWRNIFASHG